MRSYLLLLYTFDNIIQQYYTKTGNLQMLYNYIVFKYFKLQHTYYNIFSYGFNRYYIMIYYC